MLPLPSVFAEPLSPENGLYAPSYDLVHKLYYFEAQGSIVDMRIFRWDEDSQPTNYDVHSDLLTGYGGHIHAPPDSGGFWPVRAVVAHRVARVLNGPCLACTVDQFDPHENTDQWTAYTEIIFGHLTYLDGFTFPPADGSFVGADLVGRRIATNYPRVGPPLRDPDPSRFSSRLLDMRGDEWVFVDVSRPSAPTWRFRFSEYESEPETDYPVQRFIDPSQQQYQWRCKTSNGCELDEGSETVFSMRGTDMGINRLHAFLGKMPVYGDGVWRGDDTVIGLRVQSPPQHGAVLPEAGMYEDLEQAGPMYYLEVQNGRVTLIVSTWNPESGAAEWYWADASLSNDAAVIGFVDSPPTPDWNAFGPIWGFEADLRRADGPCCDRFQTYDIEANSETIGTVHMQFTAANQLRAQFSTAQGTRKTTIKRRNFGYERLHDWGQREFGATGVSIHTWLDDLRDRWVFVDMDDAAQPAWRFDWRHVRMVDTPMLVDGPRYEFLDPQRPDSVFTCGAEGCELRHNGVALFSARHADMGLDRIHGYRGALNDVEPGAYRGKSAVIGLRMGTPPVPRNHQAAPPRPAATMAQARRASLRKP